MEVRQLLLAGANRWVTGTVPLGPFSCYLGMTRHTFISCLMSVTHTHTHTHTHWEMVEVEASCTTHPSRAQKHTPHTALFVYSCSAACPSNQQTHTHTHIVLCLCVSDGVCWRRCGLRTRHRGVTQTARGNIDGMQSCCVCARVWSELIFSWSDSSSSQDSAVRSAETMKSCGLETATDPSSDRAVQPLLLYIIWNLK